MRAAPSGEPSTVPSTVTLGCTVSPRLLIQGPSELSFWAVIHPDWMSVGPRYGLANGIMRSPVRILASVTGVGPMICAEFGINGSPIVKLYSAPEEGCPRFGVSDHWGK